MKFVLFASLCIGISSDNSLITGLVGGLEVASLIGVLPALYEVANGLNNVRTAASRLTGIINAPGNASATLSSVTNGLRGATEVLQQFAAANTDLAKALVAITDNSLLSVNLIQLSGVNVALQGEANSENVLSSVFSNITKEIGVSTSSTGDLSGAANGLEDIVKARLGLIAAVKNLSGLSGATFGIALIITGVTQGLENCSNTIADLAAALLSKATNLPGVDFIGVSIGLNALSKAEADLANSVIGLTGLPDVLEGLGKDFFVNGTQLS